jgi:Na+/H+ antiporter NhaD/arsenite permease-like protein
MYVPHPGMMLPFGLLLGLIALAPLLAPKWWLKFYPLVALTLGSVTVGYYLFFLPAPATTKVFHTAHEYFSFMTLIGSLFIVSGGIHIHVKGEATPTANVVFLFIGAVLANLLGTTGASMLLIRPWLRMNKYRITGYHVVFFIFIVSNVGGCLTPIGDPPLFLGYLKGVPFWWVTVHCWPMWAIGVGFLLVAFFVLDYRNYLRAPGTVREKLAEPPDEWRFQGLWNLLFLGVILGAVFLNHPVGGREALMIGAALASYFTTAKSVHESNHFNFHPLKEVAVLFIGIFATMMPALDWLQFNAGKLAHPSPAVFYWGSGVLSSALDNAPTYLSFLSAIFGVFVSPGTVDQVQQLVQSGGAGLGSAPEAIRLTYETLVQAQPAAVAAKHVLPEQIQVAFILGQPRLAVYILAVSIGAVFFGANTYIGNGPNFMVKSIADHQKVHTPGFIHYILGYSLPYMFPMLLLVWWLFFR